MIKRILQRTLSRRTRSALRFDWLRLRARWRHQRGGCVEPASAQMHLGCGQRKIPGWLNVDVVGSEYDLDLAAPLPWPAGSFTAVVSQQVIEHLEIESELRPLLGELARVCRPGAEIWLSCPDLGKVCTAYAEDGGRWLLEDRRTRYALPWEEGMPPSQMINHLFHQGSEHKNLYDFALLAWLLEQHGFGAVEKVNEAALLARFPEFPPRRDDRHALYVRAVRNTRA